MADQATVVVTRSWTLPAEHAQIRLDAFVRQCLPHLSRRKVENVIRDRLFSVGGKIVKKGDRLAGGDQLLFRGPAAWLVASPQADDELEVPIVYEDSTILIVNKPAGMPTHGFSGLDRATLANFLTARFPRLVNVGRRRWEPGLVHRLDRETSGLVLVAKSQPAFEHLKSQFRRRKVKKIYWALVWGIAPIQGVIDLPLAHDTRDERRMIAKKQPALAKERTWNAVTCYRCIGQSHGLSLLEIDMETGVTHQIRAHLAAIGHPIVADTLYQDAQTEKFGLTRHFLHARSLTIHHPDDARALTVEAELPGELAGLLQRLKLRF